MENNIHDKETMSDKKVFEEDKLETALFYKGKGQISNGRFTIVNLPKYVDKNLTDLKVQIFPIFSTQHSDHILLNLNEDNSCNLNASPLYPSDIRNNSFVVYGSNCYFYWIVTGNYKNLDNIISNSVLKKKALTFKDRLEQENDR